MSTDDIFPIVTSADLARLLPFYRDVLGGEVHYQFPPEGDPAYVGLHFGRASLGLGHDPALKPADGTVRYRSGSTSTTATRRLSRSARRAAGSSRSPSTSPGANGLPAQRTRTATSW